MTAAFFRGGFDLVLTLSAVVVRTRRRSSRPIVRGRCGTRWSTTRMASRSGCSGSRVSSQRANTSSVPSARRRHSLILFLHTQCSACGSHCAVWCVRVLGRAGEGGEEVLFADRRGGSHLTIGRGSRGPGAHGRCQPYHACGGTAQSWHRTAHSQGKRKKPYGVDDREFFNLMQRAAEEMVFVRCPPPPRGRAWMPAWTCAYPIRMCFAVGRPGLDEPRKRRSRRIRAHLGHAPVRFGLCQGTHATHGYECSTGSSALTRIWRASGLREPDVRARFRIGLGCFGKGW
jgi:hypothetical protein